MLLQPTMFTMPSFTDQSLLTPTPSHVEPTHVGTHTYTNTLPHVFGAGAPILGGLPVVAAAKPAEEAAVAEE